MAPPPFALSLLGYRNDQPNMADADSVQSRTIGKALLELLGITGLGPAQGQTAGTMLENGVRDFLTEAGLCG